MGTYSNAGILAASIFVAANTTASPRQPKPNVVSIISDQHQANAIGCYGAENKTITGKSPTPNIDRLAQEGMLFSNAYTPSPLSAPSRASLQTGCYPSQHTAMRHKYDGTGSGERRYPGILDLLPTIGQLFRNSGYVTAAYGKMHVHGELKGVNDLGYNDVDLRFYTTYPGAHYADRAYGDCNVRYREMAPYKTKTHQSINSLRFGRADGSLTVKDNHNNRYFVETLVEREEQMFDYLVAEKSVKFIKIWAGKKPFFLYVGFEKLEYLTLLAQ